MLHCSVSRLVRVTVCDQAAILAAAEAKLSVSRGLTSEFITGMFLQIGVINFIERHFPDGVEGMASDERRRLLYQVHLPVDQTQRAITHETSK